MGFRFVSAIGLVAVAACNTTQPAIASLSSTRVEEQTPVEVFVDTVGFAPTFDLDRGREIESPSAEVTLTGGTNYTAVIVAQRVASERFGWVVPDEILPGSYRLALRTSDGRVASYTGSFDVALRAPAIERVSSPRATVVLGERGLGLEVLLANPSRCTVENVSVVPQFTIEGVDHSSEYVVQGPTTVVLGPLSQVVAAFTVDLTAATVPGIVRIDATARDARLANGCVGAVAIDPARMTTNWVVVAAPSTVLSITGLSSRPETVRAGAVVTLIGTVSNDSSVPVAVEDYEVASTPLGVVQVERGSNGSRVLAPLEAREFRVRARVPDAAVSGEVFSTVVFAIGRTEGGVVVVSPTAGPVDVLVE